jgi:hypothetical protein
MKSSLTRGLALRRLVALPLGVLAAGATLSAAQAAPDIRKQLKYQDKPGPKGAECDDCKFFKKPNGCTIIPGKISPHGWCTAFAPNKPMKKK